MPIVLRASDARFERDGFSHAPPITAELTGGARLSLALATERSAATSARLLAGILKATHGWIRIGDFDPVMQPTHAKSLVTFVSLDLPAPSGGRFERELRLRAGLWGVPGATARHRAFAALDLFGTDDAYGRAVALALIRETPLVVLDRPPPGTATLVAALSPGAAIAELRVAAGAELPLPGRLAR